MIKAKWTHDTMLVSVTESKENRDEWHLLPDKGSPEYSGGCRACVVLVDPSREDAGANLYFKGVFAGWHASADAAMDAAETALELGTDESDEPTVDDLEGIDGWSFEVHEKQYQWQLCEQAEFEERFGNWLLGLGYRLDLELSQ